MRRIRFGILCLLIIGPCTAPAWSGDEPPAPAKPRTVERAADAVLTALDTDDFEALHGLAAKDDPDPWRVAEELRYRRRSDAAEAFARAAPRTAVERLPAYVAARRDAPADARDVETAATLKRLVEAREWRELANWTASAHADPGTVTGVWTIFARGRALRALRRLAESTEVFASAAAAAEKLGWLSCAASAHSEAAHSAWRRSDWTVALSAAERALELRQMLGCRLRVSQALRNIGLVHLGRGDHPKALSFYERALALQESLGDRAEMARTLGDTGDVYSRRGDLPKALSVWERALPLLESSNDRAGTARMLVVIGLAHFNCGDYAKALSTHERALALQVSLGDRAGEARTLSSIGNAHYRQGDLSKALSHYERAVALLGNVGDRSGVAGALRSIGTVHIDLGDYAKALSYQERALERYEALGDRVGMATALANIGLCHFRRGEYPEALSWYQRALAPLESVGDRKAMGIVLGRIGDAHLFMGDFPKALSFRERALALAEAIGGRYGVAAALGNVGNVYLSLDNCPKALACFERSLALMEASGARPGVAAAMANIGKVHSSLGDYAKAFSYLERARTLMESVGDRAGVASVIASLGKIHTSLGDYPKALLSYECARAILESLGERAQAARVLKSLGLVHLYAHDYTKALSYLERARDLLESLGARADEADSLGRIGLVHLGLGDYAKALLTLERALALAKTLGERVVETGLLANIGLAHFQLGDSNLAVRHLGRAVREARRLRVRETLLGCLTTLARVRLSQGEAARALLRSQEALREMEAMFGGLAEEEGATARAEYAEIYALGTVAAARLEEPAEALTFLESGRAGSLLESLGGRQALRWTDLPEELRQAEAEAKAAEARARYDYGRALETRKLRVTRRAARALDEATDRLREVEARIQREAKRQAGLFYPRAATMEEVQGWLEEDEAVVLYALCLDEALALVLTNEDARIVHLGSAKEVQSACEESRLSDRAEDKDTALASLRKLLVDPLELPPSITTVIVSPEGPLSYVPFGALFEERNVALTPSATTHVLLRDDERELGSEVLALGDPAYGAEPDPGASEIYRSGATLISLPATRDEAMAVGDVVLLGEEASEPGLREALAEGKRWRAVHFACHGLVDPERPTLSSLALTRAGEEDGYLTALEVLRMEIPTDLTVLSACETAKGKIVKGEGILGLTRAFMYAGSPRVICSLWRVPDDATRALMTKFYELFNPEEGEGLGAAEALKRAQAFLRSHEKWARPYHWAAWVLWGLP